MHINQDTMLRAMRLNMALFSGVQGHGWGRTTRNIVLGLVTKANKCILKLQGAWSLGTDLMNSSDSNAEGFARQYSL